MLGESVIYDNEGGELVAFLQIPCDRASSRCRLALSDLRTILDDERLEAALRRRIAGELAWIDLVPQLGNLWLRDGRQWEHRS